VILMDWLKSHDLDPSKGVCVALATDGLSPAKHKLMGIGLQSEQIDFTAIYVSGADPYSAEKYTGIVPAYYQEKAVGPARARELLVALFNQIDFLIVYAAPFFKRWAIEQCDVLTECPVLDIIPYVKLVENGEHLFETTGTDIDELTSILADRTHTTKGGYSFDAVCSRILDEYAPEGNIFESKVRYLYQLYQNMLLR